MSRLTHYDDAGNVSMVDVSGKDVSKRSATAHAFVRMSPSVLTALPSNPKGNPLEVARIAGIMGAKKTSELIPLCHPLSLSHVSVICEQTAEGVSIEATAATTAHTGVEMEAMVAASVCALTIYDMTKALDKGIEITDIYLEEKNGGKSGHYRRSGERS